MKYFKGNLPELIINYKSGTQNKFKVSSSRDAYLGLKELYDDGTIEYTESFIVLFLNRANNTIAWKMVSTGGMSGVLVDPKPIFAMALKVGASSIILSHNHPSGLLRASEADLNITNKLIAGGKVLEISIIDHIIVTNKGYLSFADDGLM